MSRGIAEIQVNGQTYKFDFGLSGWRRIEEVTGKKMGEILTLFNSKQADALLLCQFVQGALQRYHPDITLDEAGDIATNMGDELNDAIEQALLPGGRGNGSDHPTQSLREAS